MSRSRDLEEKLNAAYSDDVGPLIPKEVGRLFRLKAATCSD
jgi:hypothetical protein